MNLPARRKFLKADTAEAAQISRLVTQLALGYPAGGVRAREQPSRVARGAARRLARRTVLSGLRRAARPGARRQARRGHLGAGVRRRAGRAGPGARSSARLRQPAHRPRPDHFACDPAGLQHGDHQRAQPRGASVHRDRARQGRRQRASDEGRGAVPRAGPRARDPPPGDRRRAGRREGPGTGAHRRAPASGDAGERGASAGVLEHGTDERWGTPRRGGRCVAPNGHGRRTRGRGRARSGR